MSFILNGVTLKSPAALRKIDIPISKGNTTLNGKKKYDFIRIKKSWALDIRMISQTDIAAIDAIVAGMVPVLFSASEDSLTIASTSVWVNIDGHDYSKAEYRENITLILEEE